MAHRTSHRNRPAAGLPVTTAAGLSGTRTQSAPSGGRYRAGSTGQIMWALMWAVRWVNPPTASDAEAGHG